jgi:hypothetical protein
VPKFSDKSDNVDFYNIVQRFAPNLNVHIEIR